MASKIINVTLPGNAGLLIGLMTLFPGAVHAAQWYSESSTRAQSLYDDNIRLTSGAHDAVVGMVLAGTIKTGRRTETTDLHLNGEAALKKYSGEEDLDTNDFDIGIAATHRTERDEFTLNAAIKLDSTLSSEVAGSGLMQARKRRIKKNFALSWTHALSERTSLKLGYNYIDTEYKNSKNSGLVNYTYLVIDSMLSYSLNQKTVLYSTLALSTYKGSDLAKTKTEDLGFMVGINHNFSETFSAGGSIGMRYADTESRLTQKRNDTGYLLSANFKRTFEQMTVDGLFSRNVLPSGGGALLVTDRLSVKAGYRVDERLSLHLESIIYRNASTDEEDKSRDRVFYSIQPRVRWRVARWWLIEGSYRYRRQRYDATGQAADSNAIFLTAKYIWPAKPSAGLW